VAYLTLPWIAQASFWNDALQQVLQQRAGFDFNMRRVQGRDFVALPEVRQGRRCDAQARLIFMPTVRM
jgi:hypothetical protein